MYNFHLIILLLQQSLIKLLPSGMSENALRQKRHN